MKIFRRKVKKGSKTGHTIGYPTINLNVGDFFCHYPPGVYKCEVILDNSSHIGALYFGPKLSHKGNILEVHIINYNGHIYGQFVRLKVGKKIRGPKQFTDLSELKKQIGKDLEKVV
jgi:riboflavin kinase/FMN adenylyltransferase